MGTRSLTVITSKWDDAEKANHCATIYRHWDGYPSGHGRWLADFLSDVVVTNGRVDKEKHYNGPGRLASGITAALDADDHDPDLVAKGSIMGQEYEYHIHCDYGSDGGELTVMVLDGPMTMFGGGGEDCTNELFAGTVAEFEQFISKAEADEKEPCEA